VEFHIHPDGEIIRMALGETSQGLLHLRYTLFKKYTFYHDLCKNLGRIVQAESIP
jgi:hypothetical protein